MKQMNDMGIKRSIIFFGLPGLWLYWNCTYGLPLLIEKGIPQLYSTLLLMSIPIIGILMFVFVQMKESGIKKEDFLYMKRLSIKEALVAVGLFFVVQVLELITAPSRIWLSHLAFFQAPSFYPDLLMPQYELHFPIKTFMGTELSGNYVVIILWAVWLMINILGEEIVWRGYALKRMEVHFGKWAWLVNGILWNILIHFFIRWSYISLIPVSLIVPWICQKTKSFWPGVIIHGIGNFLVYVLIIPGVFN